MTESLKRRGKLIPIRDMSSGDNYKCYMYSIASNSNPVNFGSNRIYPRSVEGK